MTPESPALFIADATGLDFLNSVATPAAVAVDWIGSGAGLVAWLDQARLVSRISLDEIRRRAMPGELDKVAGQARDLREWFRSFVQAHMGAALTTAALGELEPLNLLLEHDERYARVIARQDPDAARLELISMRRWRSPDSLLQPIGEILARLVTEEDFSHIRACEGPVCTLLFADHTRGHSRRWCSMELCGNRAKQAAHRNRLKHKL